MTRLLVPEMFGLMALAHVLITGVNLFSDLGLRQNIVQHQRGAEAAFLNTVWTVQIIRGAVIWLMAMAMAATLYWLNQLHWLPKASVYAHPLLPLVAVALSFNAVIAGFESTKVAVASRTLVLGRITTIGLVSQVTGALCMIAWAILDRSIWALVAGSLVSSATYTMLSHTGLSGSNNRLQWDTDPAREVMRFGKWVFLTSILGFLVLNGDRLVIGGLTDTTTFGLYSIAFLLISAVQNALEKVTSGVLFPALSEVARSRRETLKTIYYRARLPIDICMLLGAGFLFAAGHVIVELLYDQRYWDSGRMFQILSISLFGARFGIAGQCFIALGKPALMVPNMLARIAALYALAPLAFSIFDLDGTLWVVAASSIIALPTVFYFKHRYGLLDMRYELTVLPLTAAGYMVGIVFSSIIDNPTGSSTDNPPFFGLPITDK